MEQPGKRTPKASRRRPALILLAAVALGVMAVAVLLYPNSRGSFFTTAVATFVFAGANAALIFTSPARGATSEAQARHRVRQAEDKLSDALRHQGVYSIPLNFNDGPEGWRRSLDVLWGDHGASPGDASRKQPESDTLAAVQERDVSGLHDDRLTLAALWDVTHSRLDLYHQIATGQAKRSFGAAQVAMGIGFLVLVAFAVLAYQAKTTTAAISAGGLGAVGAAFAAYIGKTFIRSQESAASHLRAYFDQPLELSRYLAAERLLADAGDLTGEQRAAILSALVQAISTGGNGNGNAEDDKFKGSKPKS